MSDVTLSSIKNKSVHSCRFVHHAKFHCFMTMLKKLFKIKLEGGGELEKSQNLAKTGSLLVLWESSDNQFDRPRKKRQIDFF